MRFHFHLRWKWNRISILLDKVEPGATRTARRSGPACRWFPALMTVYANAAIACWLRLNTTLVLFSRVLFFYLSCQKSSRLCVFFSAVCRCRWRQQNDVTLPGGNWTAKFDVVKARQVLPGCFLPLWRSIKKTSKASSSTLIDAHIHIIRLVETVFFLIDNQWHSYRQVLIIWPAIIILSAINYCIDIILFCFIL